MSTDNLKQTVELIAMALSEDGGYEYYHVADTLKELSKDVADMQAENAKLLKLLQEVLVSHEKMCTQRGNCFACQFFDTEWSRACPIVMVNWLARELGIEVEE